VDIHSVPEKTATLFFGHNFRKRTPIFTFLSLLDSTGTLLSVIETSTSPWVCRYTTLRNLKIQYIRVSKTITSSSHIFLSNGSRLQ